MTASLEASTEHGHMRSGLPPTEALWRCAWHLYQAKAAQRAPDGPQLLAKMCRRGTLPSLTGSAPGAAAAQITNKKAADTAAA